MILANRLKKHVGTTALLVVIVPTDTKNQKTGEKDHVKKNETKQKLL